MTNYTPRVGHRVRVILESPVIAIVAHGCLILGEDADGNIIDPQAAHVVSIERVADPEPKWQPGDVVTLTQAGVEKRAIRDSFEDCPWAIYAINGSAYTAGGMGGFEGHYSHETLMSLDPVYVIVEGKAWVEATGGAQ